MWSFILNFHNSIIQCNESWSRTSVAKEIHRMQCARVHYVHETNKHCSWKMRQQYSFYTFCSTHDEIIFSLSYKNFERINMTKFMIKKKKNLCLLCCLQRFAKAYSIFFTYTHPHVCDQDFLYRIMI